MSEAYEELINGRPTLRPPPGTRHEAVCSRLHECVLPVLAAVDRLTILPPREAVALSPGNIFRPDLVLVETDSGKPWLIAEVIDAVDHLPDTVVKKDVCREVRLPRLWLLDPRYDNVEIHKASAFGIALDRILALHEVLTDESLPALSIPVRQLFEEIPDPLG